MSSPRSHSLASRSSRLTLFAFFLLAGAHSVLGQSAPGYQSPAKPQVKEESIQTKAARGQAPLAKLHGELKPDARRIKRLPALNRRDKRARSEKLLQIGVVRPLDSVLNPLTEEGTNNAAALDSVTFQRGPFRILNTLNFSTDHHTRIIFFTSDLGLTQSDLSNPAILVAEVPNFNLPVENVGPLTGIPGLVGSYVIVKLPDNIPTGALNLTIRVRGVTSDARKLNILP